MPIYEYECRVCGVHFERKQSVHDDPVQICPECGGKVRRLIFPAGIIFKGSGWYKTDNASSGYSASKKADESTPASTSTPAKSEPAKGEPAKTETSKAEPAKSTAAKAEPKPAK